MRRQPPRRFLPLRGEHLEPRLPLAYEPVLLADANREPAGFTVYDGNFVEMNGVAYYGGGEYAGGSAYSSSLWRTDGTTEGTWQVSNLQAYWLVRVGDALFFSAPSDDQGRELWKSDGTPEGTVLVKDIQPGRGSSFPGNLAAVGDSLYFSANDGTHGLELWKSDGTEAGTVLVKDIWEGAESSFPQRLTDVSGTVFFSALDGLSGGELWKSDGSATGTVRVKDIYPGPDSSMVTHEKMTNVNGTLFFGADDGVHGSELWKSDGSGQGTVLVKDIVAGPNDSLPRTTMFNVGGRLFFQAPAGPYSNAAVWVSDGTAAGTQPLPFFTQYVSPSARLHLGVGDSIYFSAGDQLWRSSGTTQDTVSLGTGFTGLNSFSQQFVSAADGIYFFQDGGLWRTDGTASGTKLVDQPLAPAKLSLSGIASLGPKILFGGYFDYNRWDVPIGNGEPELWMSTGVSGETQRVLRDDGRTASSFSTIPPISATLGNVALYVATDNELGSELWRTDGTPAGTYVLKDINPGPAHAAPSSLVQINNHLYFVANDGVHGRELWTSDGTAEGTKLLGDIRLGSTGLFDDSSLRPQLTNVNGTLYFTGPGEADGLALWKSDGTAQGTVLIKDFSDEWYSKPPDLLTNGNGTLYFRLGHLAYGDELWKSDGTAAGTTLVKDIVLGTDGSWLSNLFAFNSKLYFLAIDNTGREYVWKSDGTAAGTVRVEEFQSLSAGLDFYFYYSLATVNERLYVTVVTGDGTGQLWLTDGTPAGTRPLLESWPAGFRPYELWNAGGKLFFNAKTDAAGVELWCSDGTSAGTVLVKDILAGPASSYAGNFDSVGGILYFTALDTAGSAGLWRSDSTAAGTWPVFDAGLPAFTPRGFTSVGDRLFFLADDGIHGRELFTLDYYNAAPTFTPGTAVAARDDDGPRSIPGWASAISAGAPDEFAQELEFEVVADQPQLFLQLPRIDLAGNLTFTPKPNVRGSTTISVKLRDDELSPSGGVSESVVRTFQIDIDKPHPRHNTAKPLDVKPDGSIVASDVLEIINYINAFRSGPVTAAAAIEPPYYDVTKDNFIAPDDALAIINHINAFGAGAGEGEATATVLSGTSRLSDDLLALLTLDLAQQPKRRMPAGAY